MPLPAGAGRAAPVEASGRWWAVPGHKRLQWGHLILPETEIATEYLAELDLSQPWNSEKNRRFAKGLPNGVGTSSTT